MPPEKTHRVGRACENCNKRKIRCKPQSGMLGCEACVENGIECIARTRKKRKCYSTQYSNTQHVESIPTFLEQPQDLSQSPEAARLGPAGDAHLFHPLRSEQTLRDVNTTTRSGSITGGHGWYEDTISRLASGSQDDQPGVSLGDSSRRASLVEIPELVAQDNGTDATADPPASKRLSDIDCQILRLRSAFQLPPRPIRESLNDAFMERCYPWTPIIERSWLEDGEGKLVSLLLIQSVFLAASRVSSSPTVAAYATPKEFYQRAKALFWTGHEQDAIMTIRAACILNWYIPHGPEQVSFDTSKFWIHIAVGLSHQISLHKEPPPGRARIMRRRLWWSLVVRDSLLSASHGRPRAINLDDCDIRAPCLEDFPDSPLEGHLFMHYVEVCTMLGDLTECYARKTMSRHHKRNVQDSMSKWTTDLPEELRLFQRSNNSADHHVSRYNINARQLHVPYFVILTIMHKSITPNTGPSAISILAASFIAGIYEDFLARDEIQYLPAIFSFYGLAAAVSLVSFHRYPDLRRVAEQDLAVIMSSERELGKRWPAARGIRNALENMIASIPRANATNARPQLEVPRAEVESYFCSFGPGLCRAWNAVFSENSVVDVSLANEINTGISSFDYLSAATAMEAPLAGNPNQGIQGSVVQPEIGESLDDGMFGFQGDDIGYWLFDNSGTDFPLQ